MSRGPTLLEQMEQEAISKLIFSLIFNLALLIGGVVCLSAAFGWQIGVGIGLLFMFLKGGK